MTRGYAVRVALLTAVTDWMPKVLGLFIMFLLGRALGPGAFTTYTLALSWVTLAWSLTDQGLGGFGIRLVAAAPSGDRAGAKEILGTYCVTAVFAWLIVSSFALIATHPPLRGVLLAMSMFVLAYAAFPDWLLRGLGALPTLGRANWVTVLTWFSFASVAVLSSSVEVAAAGYAVAPVAGALVAWRWLGARGWRPTPWLSPAAVLRRLRTTWVFSVGGILGGLATALMLTTVVHVASPAAAASFALGLRVSGAAAGAGWTALQNMLPRLVRGSGASGSAWLLAAGMIPGVAATILAAGLWPSVVQPFLGDRYRSGFWVFLVGVGYLIPFGAKYVAEINLLSAFQDRARMVVGGVSLLCTGAACGLAVLTGSPWIAIIGFGAAEMLAAAVAHRLRSPVRADDAAPPAPGIAS